MIRIYQAVGCVLAGALIGALIYAWQWYGGSPATDSHSNSAEFTGAATDPERAIDEHSLARQPADTLQLPQVPLEGKPRSGASPVYSSPSYHEGIMHVAPSVVSIFASQGRWPATSPERRQLPVPREPASGSAGNSQGSGVIIDADGLVLTNFHLIDGAETIIVVQSNGAQHRAMLVGSDPATDLAVLTVNARDLPAVPIAAMPRLRVGDVVLAIGNPFGVGQTVTQGIVSAVGRRFPSASVWQYFVQIDAAINPGNSGGALINPGGQFVGLTSAVLGRDVNAEGIGLAIPAELLVQVVPQIIANGRVRRGWLGIGVEDLAMFPEFAEQFDQGAVVTWIESGGPAATAGLALNDVITAVDDRVVFDHTELLLAISALPPAQLARLDIVRNGEHQTLEVTLDERPADERAGLR